MTAKDKNKPPLSTKTENVRTFEKKPIVGGVPNKQSKVKVNKVEWKSDLFKAWNSPSVLLESRLSPLEIKATI